MVALWSTTERWEEQFGQSPSSIAAIIAGLVAAADIARQNGDPTSDARWESTADLWRSSIADWTFTTDGFFGDHRYYERIDPTLDPNGSASLCFQEGCFFAHDVADFGFLDLVRLGVVAPNDPNVSTSLSPSASASDGNSTVQVTMPNGDIYFHRYNHDNYGESNSDCTGFPANGPNRYGRLWSVLSGERGEYELANGRSADIYLQSMADAANDGHFVPEQIFDHSDKCFTAGRPAAPLRSTGLRANTCASPSRSTPVTPSPRRPSSRRSLVAQVRSSAPPANVSTTPAQALTTALRSRSSRVTGRARRAGPG